MPEVSLPFSEIKGWFFDLDGTLMDTDDQAVDALAHRLRFFGPVLARRLARRAVMFSETPMNGMLTMLDMVGLDAVLFAVRRRMQGPPQPTFRAVENVVPLLTYLAEQTKLAVVSTRSTEAAEVFLRQYDLMDLFSLVVGQESTWRLKPHPAPLHYAMDKLDLPPSRCAMVGDTPVDMWSARKAGVWAVGVLCGFGEEAELWRSGAHIVLPSTGNLLGKVRL